MKKSKDHERAIALGALDDFEKGRSECCRCGKVADVLDFLMPYMQMAQQLCKPCIEQIAKMAKELLAA